MDKEFPKHLTQGYDSFRRTRLPIEQDHYRELAKSGQKPKIMVIGCCDSRVSPEVIFDAMPGELFVVRNVANLVPPYSPDGLLHGVSAALEFAVQALKIEHIVVLGHARCGGIKAFAEKDVPLSPGDFIGKWMSLIAPAAKTLDAPIDLLSDDYLMRLEKASALKTLTNLMTFPFVRTLVESGDLHLHAAYFEVMNGSLSVYDSKSGKFLVVK